MLPNEMKEMSALAGGLALRGAAWYWWAARRHAVETPLYAGPPLALPELGACGRRVNATLPTVACAAAYARRPAARVAAGALSDQQQQHITTNNYK